MDVCRSLPLLLEEEDNDQEKKKKQKEEDEDIHPKNWLSLLENSAENSNFPQKDCLRTRKLSILQCVKKRSTGIFEDQSELKSLAEQVLGFRS